MPHWDGGLWQRTSLGAQAASNGPRRASDGTAVRQTLRQNPQNDVADAEAICEAVGRPNMRFLPIRNVEQQGVLALHRVRQGFVKARTAQGNQIRGLFGEFGIIIPQGISNFASRVPEQKSFGRQFKSVTAYLWNHGVASVRRPFFARYSISKRAHGCFALATCGFLSGLCRKYCTKQAIRGVRKPLNGLCFGLRYD